MKVILTQDVKGSGKSGQLIEVSDGFARNFLFPKKLALEATAQNISSYEQKLAAAAHKEETEKAEAQAFAKSLSQKTVTVNLKAGKDGRVFGSVGSKEISDALLSQLKLKIDKKKISCDTIKKPGEYKVEIKLYTNISAVITVTVNAVEQI